jgi:hypothetical protein
MLALRPALALALQVVATGLFALAASLDPFRAAADWWLAWFALASALNLILLRRFLRIEGVDLRAFYLGRTRDTHPDRGADVRWVVVGLLVAGPLGILPNMLLSSVLWGDTSVGAALTFRPLPAIAALAILGVFPIVHALAELPTYFGYVMPRLANANGRGLRAVVVCAAVLSVQHVFLPLILDWRYVVWRAFMFLPFALWLGYVIYRRPTTLPYLVVAHALLDTSLPLAVLMLPR